MTDVDPPFVYRFAPDLYRALKAFVEAGDGHDDFEEQWPGARAALAKAEGKDAVVGCISLDDSLGQLINKSLYEYVHEVNNRLREMAQRKS